MSGGRLERSSVSVDLRDEVVDVRLGGEGRAAACCSCCPIVEEGVMNSGANVSDYVAALAVGNGDDNVPLLEESCPRWRSCPFSGSEEEVQNGRLEKIRRMSEGGG